jgi:hypothetical protein
MIELACDKLRGAGFCQHGNLPPGRVEYDKYIQNSQTNDKYITNHLYPIKNDCTALSYICIHTAAFINLLISSHITCTFNI